MPRLRRPRPPLPRFAVAWFPSFPGIGAIAVTFRAVRMHANEFVFIMPARGAASIVALHDMLYTRSLRPHLRPEFPYEPHITIARHADPRDVEAAYEEAREAFGRELDDVMREVELLALDPDGKIEGSRRIALHST